MLEFGLLKRKPTHTPTPTVPKMVQASIGDVQLNTITVLWDRPMQVTCDIKSQITVIIDGVVEPVTEVVFHPTNHSLMGFFINKLVEKNQVITWAYDDSGSCILQEVEEPKVEADNQTYKVYNTSTLVVTADTDRVTADTELFTADKE